MFVWLVLGFGVFFLFGFSGRRWFSVVVVVVSGMGWICSGGCYGFLDLGLDAMVWLGFMAGGGSSRSEVREGEWGFGCENQRNHQEGEWESRSMRKKDKKRKV